MSAISLLVAGITTQCVTDVWIGNYNGIHSTVCVVLPLLTVLAFSGIVFTYRKVTPSEKKVVPNGEREGSVILVKKSSQPLAGMWNPIQSGMYGHFVC